MTPNNLTDVGQQTCCSFWLTTFQEDYWTFFILVAFRFKSQKFLKEKSFSFTFILFAFGVVMVYRNVWGTNVEEPDNKQRDDFSQKEKKYTRKLRSGWFCSHKKCVKSD